MSKLNNLVGQRFGSLVVISRAGINKEGRATWKCECDCGNMVVVLGRNLLRGNTKSCGCKAHHIKSLVGEKFGRVTVLSFAGCKKDSKGRSAAYWNCVCDCGKKFTTRGNCLTQGNTLSCGCLNREKTIARQTKHGLYSRASKKENQLYRVWEHMKRRCYNPNDKHYKDYGGRGITVCDEWRDDFGAFHDWAIANGYKKEVLPNGINKWTIDRIDNEEGYFPDNCRWITIQEQQYNKRGNRHITHNGETMTIAEMAKKYGMDDNLFRDRLRYGWSMEDILSRPKEVHTQRRYQNER